MKPIVSVIIPAYNCNKTIEKCIDSVLHQNMETEIIIVDDCSKEELLPVLKKYESYQGFVYLKNESNRGVAYSRNKGVKAAKGEYVAFLDSDDWWQPGKLEKQIKRMKKDQTVICSTGRVLVRADGVSTKKYIGVKDVILYKDLLKHNPIACSSVLMKKEVALEFPMEHDECHEDYITWLKILKKYEKASGINEPCLCYRLSPNSKSGTKLKSAYMTYMVYRHIGFGRMKSAACFISYALHGIKKYYSFHLKKNGV